MKNLENYGVLELNAKELQEVEGGVAPIVVYGAWLCAGIIVGALIRGCAK
jgi:lactobin A/cerein 7B family class IIb bacteriocin